MPRAGTASRVRIQAMTSGMTRLLDIIFYLSAALLPLLNQFIFGRQTEFVFQGGQLTIVVQYGVFDNRIVPFGTQDDTDSRIVGFRPHVFLKVTGMEIHLSDVLLRAPSHFQVDQDKTFENIAVENPIDVVVLVIGLETVLTPNERETAPQLQQELLQVVD